MLKQQGVTQSGDVYQIGVVLYEMLVGIPPFYNDNIKVLYENIEKGKLKVPKYLSSQAKKLLPQLLHRDPRKRPTLSQLKKDPFFAEINWPQLERRECSPPALLLKSSADPTQGGVGSSETHYYQQKQQKEKDEIELMFERVEQESGAGGADGAAERKVIFDDEDYEEHNKRHNRVKNYSFSIGRPKWGTIFNISI